MSKHTYSKEGKIKTYASRKKYLPIYTMTVAIIVGIVYVSFQGYSLSKYALIAAGAFVLMSIKMTEIHRISNKYEIGDGTLVHSKGIFNKSNPPNTSKKTTNITTWRNDTSNKIRIIYQYRRIS